MCQEQKLCTKLHTPDLRGDTMQGDGLMDAEDVDVASERCDSEEGTRGAAWKQFFRSFSLDD